MRHLEQQEGYAEATKTEKHLLDAPQAEESRTRWAGGVWGGEVFTTGGQIRVQPKGDPSELPRMRRGRTGLTREEGYPSAVKA